ncbi:hypothetical protein BC938DRAFT_471988, partial [Jimgerdemannia flammicorona]
MESILEQQRSAHEEIERLEQAIVDQHLKNPKTHKERLTHEHRVCEFLDRISSRSHFLHNLYEDTDGARKTEIDALSGANEFSEFYARLKSVKDYHRRYPNESVEPLELEFLNQAQKEREDDGEDQTTLFSGEEGGGRFLDLNAVFERYLNLKGVRKMDYLIYLSEFDDFEGTLKSYFEDFFRRAKPLFNITDLRSTARATFEEQWREGKVIGWEKQAGAEEEMESGLFCPACEKQFTKQTVYDAHLKGKKHIKAAEVLLAKGVANPDPVVLQETRAKAVREREDKDRELAWQERLVARYAEVLGEQREDTKANVERKQALTDRERTVGFDAITGELWVRYCGLNLWKLNGTVLNEILLPSKKKKLEHEQETIDITMAESDDDDEDKIYNPLKLPLGWDGKPIPYWLYKLHGLGVEYPCEICGNYVYMGRKAFDKHFQEWRHAHGMRCLGIPNTRHFHEITMIEDAYARKLRVGG